MGEDTAPASPSRRRIGLLLGPILAFATYAAIPSVSLDDTGRAVGGLAQPGRAVAAVGVLMATLWISEALPIPATALLPIALFPLLTGGGVCVKAAAAPYASDLIFLFLGGFVLAIAMERWGLHRRIALRTILLVGTNPARLVGGFMLATAFVSLWVSNTAAVVMMLPIALSVLELVRGELRKTGAEPPPGRPFNFAICLMLGVAYASSIGGLGTLIGTPPNTMMAAFLKEQYQIEISFVRWLSIGLPLVAAFLPIAWLLLTRIVFPIRLGDLPGGRALIRRELEKQGPASRGEGIVCCLFAVTALAWITRPLLTQLEFGSGFRPLAGLSDAGIAIGAAVLLFALPVYPRRGVFVLTWPDAVKLPWGVLILFGGGLSLAQAIESTGVAEFIGRSVTALHGWPVWVLALCVTTTMIFLTELTSNTATTATFLPILGAAAVGLGISPTTLVIPATVAASCAFMMPVGTPPNALVFSSGAVTIPQMCKAGLWLNLIGIVVIMAVLYGIAMPLMATTK